MKIAFHGAARTVTGSKHLLTLKNGKKILLDCGMFQGLGKETDMLNRDFGFDPREADVMLLDSAEIQEDEVKYTNKRRAMEGLPYLRPLYTMNDAKNSSGHFAEV